MKLHEALRQLFAKYGGRVMDEDAHFDIMGWLSDRQVFDSYPAMKLAMLAVLSNGYGRELWEYSCAGNDARYFKFADWVKQNLMNPYSVQLTGYVVDSVSYGLGMKRTASDAQDLDIRLQDLIASDADAWVKDVDLRKPARIIRRLQCCCLLWFFGPLILFLILSMLPSLRPGIAGALAMSAFTAAWSRMSGESDGKHGFLSDVMGAVGLMYYSGSMVEKDYGRAMIWLRRDWDHSEDERAAAAIGTMYYYGYGTVKNYPEAEGWFRKAAGKGLAPAETGIGNMYYFGRGVMQDYGEAAKWYLKAAGKGDRAARNNLAAMKAAGQGRYGGRIIYRIEEYRVRRAMADAGIYWQAFTDYSTDSISYALGLRKSALAPFDFGFRYTAGTFDSIKYMLMCAAMGAGCAWMGFLQWKSGEEISEVAGGGAIAFVIAIVVLGFRR